MNCRVGIFLSGLAALCGALPLFAQQGNVNVTVRQAPYVVTTVSTKTERGSAPCRYCQATIRYDRTFKWDVYEHVWVETTKEVPDTCKKCRAKLKEQEKLDKRERDLDRKIEYEETRQRIDKKEKRYSRLRNQR